MNGTGQRKKVLTTGTAFDGAPVEREWDYSSMSQRTAAQFTSSANRRASQYDIISLRSLTVLSAFS